MRALIVVIGSLVALPALAQENALLAPGARVRLYTDCPSAGRRAACDRYTATIAAIHGDSLVIEADEGTAQRTVPLDRIVRVDVSRGNKSAWRTGALIGAVAGGLIAGTAAYSIASANYPEGQTCWPISAVPDECRQFSAGWTALGIGLLGTLVGGGVGAVVGSAFEKEAWLKVLEVGYYEARLQLVPGARGARVAASISF